MRIELSDDHTGDPSMWIVFNLHRGFDADRNWVSTFAKFDTELCLKLIHSGLSRFPYSRIEQPE